MSSDGSKKKAFKDVNGKEQDKKENYRFGSSSLVIDESELRRAGIRNYYVEVKCCTDGKWSVLYEKRAEIAPEKENLQK